MCIRDREGAAHILNLRIKGVRSEVLLHALEDHGIYVSSGSACASNKPDVKSPALGALGMSAEAIDESVRVSFSKDSTLDEMDRVVKMCIRDRVKICFHLLLSEEGSIS